MSLPETSTAIPLEAHPPISLDLFSELTGLSLPTIWRYRRKGWLQTVNLCGRQFVTREALVTFNRRLAAGEFAAQSTIAAINEAKKKAAKK